MNTLRTEIVTSLNAGPNAGPKAGPKAGPHARRSNRLASDLIRGKAVRVGEILKMPPSRLPRLGGRDRQPARVGGRGQRA